MIVAYHTLNFNSYVISYCLLNSNFKEFLVLNKAWAYINQLVLLTLVCFLIGLGWQVAHGHYYKPGDVVGYNLGLVGGLMMLTLLLYSARKHLPFLQKLGKLKYWFKIHMILGVAGPTLVLFHTTFKTGSINATIAFYSMLLVAGSGLIGRFVYTKIHNGLYGSRSSLSEAREELAGSSGQIKSKLHFFPKVEKWIDAFEHEALEEKRGFFQGVWYFPKLRYFLSFDVRRILLILRCKRQIHRVLGNKRMQEVEKEAVQLISKYLSKVQTVAQFKKFEQIFSAWHILHIPLMFMMVGTAIFHVIWVHMY